MTNVNVETMSLDQGYDFREDKQERRGFLNRQLMRLKRTRSRSPLRRLMEARRRRQLEPTQEERLDACHDAKEALNDEDMPDLPCEQDEKQQPYEMPKLNPAAFRFHISVRASIEQPDFFHEVDILRVTCPRCAALVSSFTSINYSEDDTRISACSVKA